MAHSKQVRAWGCNLWFEALVWTLGWVYLPQEAWAAVIIPRGMACAGQRCQQEEVEGGTARYHAGKLSSNPCIVRNWHYPQAELDERPQDSHLSPYHMVALLDPPYSSDRLCNSLSSSTKIGLKGLSWADRGHVANIQGKHESYRQPTRVLSDWRIANGAWPFSLHSTHINCRIQLQAAMK